MSGAALPVRSWVPRIEPVNRRLALLLAALLAVFSMMLSDRLFTSASLRSMAFQLPELGILSLAMMIPLLSGGLDLSIISTANLVTLTIAFIFKSVPGDPGAAWVARQVAAILAALPWRR